MIGFNDTIANAILDAIFTQIGDPVYLALLTAEPADSDTGSTMPELAYSGYARASLAATDFDAATDRARSVNVEVEFPQLMTAVAAPVTHAALLSASTAGTIKWVAELDAPLELTLGDVPTIAVGALALALV